MGNPLSYYNGAAYTFTWTQGRRLETATTGGKALSFTYNESGIRTSKIVDGEKHEYVLDGTKIISDSWTENNIKHLVTYIYDAKGVIGMAYRNSSMSAGVFEYYIFEKNLQGDIVAVYDTSGTKFVSYTYDAWGNITTNYSNGGGSTAVKYNSFRYRGYFYDEDTGLYYLNSRYYDPATGRFINADVYVSTGQGLGGYNMYAYCRNEPVFRKDSLGTEDVCVTNTEDDDNPLNDLGKSPSGGSGGKVHGNSKLSINIQHSYDIYEVSTGDVVKTGISGRPLNQNDTSPRANEQINALNRIAGYSKYGAVIINPNIMGRSAALEFEQTRVDFLYKQGYSMDIHKRPKPRK